jgi:glycosyltransferase involved in cell wall biosynthesis
MSLLQDLRIALVHDWLTGMRGGEKCLEGLVRLFPRADIFALIHLKGRLSPAIEARNIRTSFIQRLPLAAEKYRYYLPLFPKAVESFDLSGYDLVISSSHCVAKGAVTGGGTCHICYCFTPMRYAWDQYEAYFGDLAGPKAWVVRKLIGRLRAWDVRSAGRPYRYLTISRFVAERIGKYYHRDSLVVYPPVDTDFFTPSAEEGSYYLVVSALAPYKRLDVVVRAADRLPFPVKIVGCGPEEERLRKMAGPQVEFMGWLPDDQVLAAYRGCRAFLFPGMEDFGLTPLEAMACGKPVIAYGRGGIIETVVPAEAGAGEAPTGVYFSRQDPGDLVDAVRLFEERRDVFDPSVIRRRAMAFSGERYRASMAAAVEGIYREWRSSRGS